MKLSAGEIRLFKEMSRIRKELLLMTVIPVGNQKESILILLEENKQFLINEGYISNNKGEGAEQE